jgi:DisA bacterial checkpoint controller nucleotide-binding
MTRASHRATPTEPTVPVFPPALVRVLRDRFATEHGCLAEVTDEVIVQLLTTVFFAGLETYEGERNPIGVAFLGKSQSDFIIPEGAESGGALLYQWKVLQFDSPRPFAIRELVKLAVAGVDRRIYSAVRVLEDGSLAIAGLAREGLNASSDAFVKIIASSPGCLSIRRGRDLLIGYERGTILTGGEDLVFSAGPIRRALETTARSAGLDGDAVSDYLNAVRSIVREMAAHGRGGIVIISHEEQPQVADSATYKMVLDSSLAALLRLVRHIKRKQEAGPQWPPLALETHKSSETTAGEAGSPPFGHLLRNALLTEIERVIEEFGALTGIDGAILLNRDLALMAFGVILPVGRPTAVAQAVDAEGLHGRIIDLGSRGTRHRAGVTYAARHPGSVVFVASEDGQVSCLFRSSTQHQVRLWRLGPTDAHIS